MKKVWILFFFLIPFSIWCGGLADVENPTVPVARMYKPDDTFSDTAAELKGKLITMRGYMAPPLKPDADFFVLTRKPNALCPYCSSEVDWPEDIVVIYPEDGIVPLSFSQAIEVTGVLEIGEYIDEATGFYSKLRLVKASYKERR